MSLFLHHLSPFYSYSSKHLHIHMKPSAFQSLSLLIHSLQTSCSSPLWEVWYLNKFFYMNQKNNSVYILSIVHVSHLLGTVLFLIFLALPDLLCFQLNIMSYFRASKNLFLENNFNWHIQKNSFLILKRFVSGVNCMHVRGLSSFYHKYLF